MASSKNTELNTRLRRFVYETAAMKGRRLERAVMAQFRVTSGEVGPGVNMSHYKQPKAMNALSDASNVDGVDKSSNSFSTKRVSPQDTGNFISSIHSKDNLEECVNTLSGTPEINVGTDVAAGEYIMKPKGKSYGRRSGRMVKVPHTRSLKYKKNLDQYNNDDEIPDDWLANWDKIVRSNIKRIV